MSGEQIALFGGGQPRWFIPTNRANLLGILAGGIIRPKFGCRSYEPDLFQLCPDKIPVVQKGYPADFVAASLRVPSELFPVLLELEVSRFYEVPVSVPRPGSTALSSRFEDSLREPILLLQGVIPLSCVCALHFPSDDALKDFEVREFEDVPIGLVPCFVSPGLFDCAESPAWTEWLGQVGPEHPANSVFETSELGECLAGALTGLLLLAPNKKPWLEAAADYLSAGLNGHHLDPASQSGTSWVPLLVPWLLAPRLRSSSAERATDTRLLLEFVDQLSQFDPRQGMDPVEVVSGATLKLISKGTETGDEAAGLEKWLKTTCEILRNQRDLPLLDDRGRTIRKGILLFLLRPELEDLLAARHSSLRPGEAVLVTAGLLSGLWSRFERLPSRIKAKQVDFMALAEWKAAVINRALGATELALAWSSGLPRLEVNSTGGMAQVARITWGRFHLLERSLEADLALRLVSVKGEEEGYRFAFDARLERLSIELQLPENRKQTVFVSPGVALPSGERTVRIWSACLDLTTPTNRKRLTAAMMREILVENSRENLHCRFALDEAKHAVIVLVDQIVETLDQKELSAHLTGVAQAADAFERRMGLDVY